MLDIIDHLGLLRNIQYRFDLLRQIRPRPKDSDSDFAFRILSPLLSEVSAGDGTGFVFGSDEK